MTPERRLEEILVDEGLANPSAVATVLAEQHELEFVDFTSATVVTMTDEIALLVGAPTREIEQMAVSQGMTTLRDDGLRLAWAGLTTLEEVRRVVGETLIDAPPRCDRPSRPSPRSRVRARWAPSRPPTAS